MKTLHLETGPYETDLWCLYCGTQTINADKPDSINECSHLVHYGMDDSEDDSHFTSREGDLCIEYVEDAPASRLHRFVYRCGG